VPWRARTKVALTRGPSERQRERAHVDQSDAGAPYVRDVRRNDAGVGVKPRPRVPARERG
jgi:hypothetical protein